MHEFDVVVVGSGIAGLTSAISALENGARVAVVERSTPEESGGNTRYTEAFLRMASQEKPSDDLEDRLLGDHMGHPDPGILADAMSDRAAWSQPMRTLDVADGETVMRLGEEAPPTLDWLNGHGIRFDALPTPFLTQAAPRMSPVGGGWELVKTLTARAQELGAQYFYETTALGLVLDDDRRVVGLRTSRGVLRGNVVLASGGFEGNAEMLARYMGPSAINTRPDLGAALWHLWHIHGAYGFRHTDPAYPYGIRVKRFPDWFPGDHDQVSLKMAWILLDASRPALHVRIPALYPGYRRAFAVVFRSGHPESAA